MTAGVGREELLALVRRGWKACVAGDLEAVLEGLDPEIEVYAAPEVGNAGTYRGREEFIRWLAAWNEAWGSFESDIRDIVPVGLHPSFETALAVACEREGLEPKGE